MSKKIDRKITIKPKDIPNIDSEEVGTNYEALLFIVFNYYGLIFEKDVE